VDQPRFFTLEQVAEELSTSAAQVYALVRRGDLVAIRLGGRGQWRVERTKLEEFIDRLYQETAQYVKDNPLTGGDD
jgi:excisionase family DNA binding protein